ncbi:MAG: hypothetical protein R2710_31415 [Acidimicrobiales bacterium]
MNLALDVDIEVTGVVGDVLGDVLVGFVDLGDVGVDGLLDRLHRGGRSSVTATTTATTAAADRSGRGATGGRSTNGSSRRRSGSGRLDEGLGDLRAEVQLVGDATDGVAQVDLGQVVVVDPVVDEIAVRILRVGQGFGLAAEDLAHDGFEDIVDF